ncbi:MAG: hypothetical protein JWM73_2805 [Solirubrobacterales bacterium]|nr:hypothetical protein [Solirubrobacterales bacterium]
MLPHSHGRRIVLTGLITAIAALGLSSSALAAGTVTVTGTTTGFNSDTTPNAPHNRTEDRTPQIDFTVAGAAPSDTNTCNVDGTGAVACGGTGNGNFSYTTGTLKLGGHTVVILNSGGGTDSYSFRIEPPQYFHLIRSYSNLKGFWELDDLASASTATDSSGNFFDGDYKNFPIKRQVPAVNCENQPHPPFACDWEHGLPASGDPQLDPDTAQPTYNTVDGSGPLVLADRRGRDSQGWSAYFGGSDDHVQIENMPNGTNPSWAVEAWVKPDFYGESRGIFQHVPTVYTVQGTTPTDTRFACAGLNDEPNAVTSADISQANFVGKWFHVVCKYSAGTYTLYVNYTDSTPLLNKYSAPSGDSYVTPNGGAYQGFIGLVNKSSDKWWKGWIDNVSYYDSASPMSDSAVSFDREVGTISDSRYDAGANGTNTDQSPPSQGSDISIPANNSQYSADAQSYKDPKAQWTCNGSTSVGGVTSTAVTASFLSLLVPVVGTSGIYKLECQEAGTNYTWYHQHAINRHGPIGSGFVNLIKCLVPAPASGCSAPFAYYRLNEPSGASVIDDEMNAFDGEYKNLQDAGGPGISGDGNGTHEFFGSGYGYGYVNNIAVPLWGYTLEGWWNPADTGAMMIMQHGSNGAIWYDGTNLNFRPDERGGTAQAPIAVTPGQWYYVAGTYDGITGKLYVRQSVNPNVTLNAPATVASHYQDGAGSADTFYLGYGDQLGGNGWLRGKLDEVAYYSTALSQQKLTEHFNADPPAARSFTASSSNKAKAAKARAKAMARAKAKAKAHAKAMKKAKARAKARAKAKAKARAKHHRH